MTIPFHDLPDNTDVPNLRTDYSLETLGLNKVRAYPVPTNENAADVVIKLRACCHYRWKKYGVKFKVWYIGGDIGEVRVKRIL